MNEQDFAAWLERNHYRRTVVKKTIADARRVDLRGTPSDLNAVKALRRYLTFAQETNTYDDHRAFAERLSLEPIEKLPTEKPSRRKLEARSFGEDDWSKLASGVVGSSDPRDQVLWAMYTTGLRVGDVLRIERPILKRALQTGVLEAERKGGTFIQVPLGVLDPWKALFKGMQVQGLAQGSVPNIAAYVADGDPNPDAGGAAYQRIDRRLKAWQRKLQLQGRAHTHRLRRTVAVQALEATNNPLTVQQMLGNATMSAATRYVDEVNVRRVSVVQQQLYQRGRAR